MIASLFIRMFLGGIAPKWLTGPAKTAMDIIGVALLLWGVYAWIHHAGVKAGEAKVTAKVEKDHQAAVAAAVTDTKAAQATTDQIGATTARTNAQVTALVQSKIQEMHNAIDAIPASAAGAALPPAPVDSLRDKLNALGDGANRAADDADAEP